MATRVTYLRATKKVTIWGSRMTQVSQRSIRAAQDKKTLKIAYLESENRNLNQMVDDLQTTLAINKNIIRSLLDSQKKGNNANSDYVIL